MIKNLFRKFNKDEGGLIGLFAALLFGTLGAFLIFMVVNQGAAVENQQNEIGNSLEVGAELRALRINNPLKEAFGFIEAMPTNQDPEDYDVGELPLGYEYDDFGTNSLENTAYIEQLDQEVFDLVKEDVSLNSNGMVALKEGNFCIKTIPLPAGRGEQKTITCDFEDGTYTFTPYIDGLDHPATKTAGFQITNAVFVAGRFDVELLYKGLPLVLNGLEGLDPTGRTVGITNHAVAYPHVEQATNEW